MAKKQITLDLDLHRRLKMHAAEKGITMKQAIAAFLDKEGKK